MYKKLFYWELVGSIFTIIFGILLHFTYEWSNENMIVAAFSAVNESVWEHLKLLIMPMSLFSVVEYLAIRRKYHNFIPAKTIGMLIGLFIVVSFVYTYTGIIGTNILFIDILIFVIGVLIAHVTSYFIIKNLSLESAVSMRISIIILFILIVCFVVFTYFPPTINPFLDSTTQTYGIE